MAHLKTSLAYLAEIGDFDGIKVEIQKNPRGIDDINHEGRHALITATIKQRLDIVHFLLECSSNVNLVDRGGDTALMYASVSGNEALCKLLLDFGADVNYINPQSGLTALFEAIAKGSSSLCCLLIAHPSIDLNHRMPMGKDTALILAAEAGLYTVVEDLIEKGANLHAVNQWSCTAMIGAIKKHHLEIAKLLARSGADIHHKDSSDQSSVDLLKHNPEQQVALMDCGNIGMLEAEALQKLQRDEDALYSTAMMGEIQKMNVALYILDHWHVSSIEKAMRIVNLAVKPAPPTIEQSVAVTGRKRAVSGAGTGGAVGANSPLPPGMKDHRASIAGNSPQVLLTRPGGGQHTSPDKQTRRSSDGSTPVSHGLSTPHGTGSSPSGPVAGLMTPGTALRKSIRMKDNPLVIHFDCKNHKLPVHWLNHLFVPAVAKDKYLQLIDLTGNDLTTETASQLVDVLKHNNRIKKIRTGHHGLDFDLTVEPPVWYVDATYFSVCSVDILSRVLQHWPILFIAVDPTSASVPAVFAGGSHSSRINPIVLEAFVDLAGNSDFHPQDYLMPIENTPSMKSTSEVSQGFIFDIYHHALWFHIISMDSFATLAKAMATEYPHLAQICDHLHRDVLSQASPECKRSITSAFLIYNRYRIDNARPVHSGLSSTVFFAFDEMSDINPRPAVALKFIKERLHFHKEVGIRKIFNQVSDVILDCYMVGEVREYYDKEKAHLGFERLKKFRTDIKRLRPHQRTLDLADLKSSRKGGNESMARLASMDNNESYPYCIVFPAADHDLVHILHHVLVGEQWDQIKLIAKQVCLALQKLHSLQYVHGDVRPMNVMRCGHAIKLIDLDASQHFTQCVGSQSTPGYMPPELVFLYHETIHTSAAQGAGSVVTGNGTARSGSEVGSSNTGRLRAKIKFCTEDENGKQIITGKPYTPVKASGAYDMWSFGVLLYYMCLKESLWLENSLGEISEESLIQLGTWTPELKAKKLTRISNPLARNLVAQLLSFDPKQRPSATRALAHPFLSGNSVARMVGETANFDVFINYRVKADRERAIMLYEELTARGLKCFIDKRCLKPGISWEQGFCDGLAQSLTFVALISKNAINDPNNARCDFTKLSNDSPVDNVFLEYRLAFELRDVGLIERVLPVMIGEPLPDGTLSNTRCSPKLSGNVVVDAVEEKLKEHLERLGLGTPLKEKQTVVQVMENMMANQATTLFGVVETAMKTLGDEIEQMVKEAKEKAKSKQLLSPNDIDYEQDDLALLVSNLDQDLGLHLDHVDSNDLADEFDLLVASPMTPMSVHRGRAHSAHCVTAASGVRGVLAAKDKRIQELEEENRELQEQLAKLRGQLLSFSSDN